MSVPTVEARSWSVQPTASSPLGFRLTVFLIAAVMGVTVAVFGVGVMVIFVMPGVREDGLSILGTSVLLSSLLHLAVIHLFLRRAQSGWRALGFDARPVSLSHRF